MSTPREQLAELMEGHEIYQGLNPETSELQSMCSSCPITFEHYDYKAMDLHLADAIIAAGWTPPTPATNN